MIGQFLGALAFLTRIPVPASVHADTISLKRCGSWYPLVGLLLGSIYAGSAWLLAQYFPAAVTAVLVLIIDALLTGALHLDGLADMADGFGGGRTRDDVLRIMRDHAIGSYGGVALILLSLFKVACLAELVTTEPGRLALLMAPALSRWSIVLLTQLAPYARALSMDSPAGSGALAETIGRPQFAIATALCVPLPLIAGSIQVLISWAVVLMTTLFMAGLCRKRIGGITGDTLGANTVIAEAAEFAVALLVIRT